MRIGFKTCEKETYTIVKFELDGPIDPIDLQEIKPPRVNGTKGVILSGRGPIWLYCYLAHWYHHTRFVATHDPRVGGAIIVETHHPTYKIGRIVLYGGEKNE